jgi:hypothetical protein
MWRLCLSPLTVPHHDQLVGAVNDVAADLFAREPAILFADVNGSYSERRNLVGINAVDPVPTGSFKRASDQPAMLSRQLRTSPTSLPSESSQELPVRRIGQSVEYASRRVDQRDGRIVHTHRSGNRANGSAHRRVLAVAPQRPNCTKGQVLLGDCTVAAAKQDNQTKNHDQPLEHTVSCRAFDC